MTSTFQRGHLTGIARWTRRVKSVLPITLAAATLPWIAGCAQVETAKARTQDVETAAVDLRDRAVANATSAAISRTSRPRLAGEEIALRAQNSLPPAFYKPMSYSTQGAESLSDVLTAIGDRVSIPVRATELAQSEPSFKPVPALAVANATAIQGKVQLEYGGTLRGLLDELASRNDASWRYQVRTNTIEFYKFETRTLSLNIPAAPKTVEAAIALSGTVSTGSTGGGGGGTASVSQTLAVNPWPSIMLGIQSILGDTQTTSTGAPTAAAGGKGGGSGGGTTATGSAGRASATPELGIITVTARPAALARIVNYVESINQRFATNVMIDIKVYNVSRDSQSSAGFSLDAFYRKLNDYGVAVTGPSPLQAATGTPGQVTVSASNQAGRWAGSSLIAKALSQFGTVALQRHGQVIAINGQPSPYQMVDEVNYIASTTTTTVANAGITSTQTPGSRVVGFTANFLPVILGDNRILLQYQVQLSALTAMTQASASSIQTPQISSQTLQQQAFVRDGESVVLFGFDQSRDSIDSALGLGGASKASRSERQMVVIVMTVSGGTKHAA